MRYTPLSVSTADLVVARKMTIGADKRLFANRRPMLELGAIYMASDGPGVWTPDRINLNAGALVNPGDIVLVVDNELAADAGDVVATLAVTFDDDSSGEAQVTCKAPNWVADKSHDFQGGIAWDLVGTAGNSAKKVKAIAGLASITNALRGSDFAVCQLPDTGWQEIGFVETVEPRIASRPGIAIPDRYKPAADVVPGRPEQSKLSINTKHRAVVDGLGRFSGKNACFMLEVWKGRVLTERHVFSNSVIETNPNFGDGND